MGRSARGVRGMKLEGDDELVGVAAVNEDLHNWVLTVTQNGYGKRTDIERYRRQSRNGKGLIDIKTNERNGPVCAMETVGYGDHLFVMSESGQILRTPVEDISTVGRNTMGVIVMEMDPGDHVASVDVRQVGSDEVDDEEAVEPAEGEADVDDDADTGADE
jgi:DNA gyrase subunit A